MQIKLSKSIITLFALTLVAGELAFLIYFVEKIAGLLPNESIWYENGINHGPWRSGIESLTVYYPLILLSLITIIASVIQAVKKKWNLFWQSLIIFFIQILLFFIQVYFLAWTID